MDYAEANFNLGSAYLRLGKPDLALKQFESTLAVSQDDVTANYNAGMIRARQGRWTDAIESFLATVSVSSVGIGRSTAMSSTGGFTSRLSPTELL